MLPASFQTPAALILIAGGLISCFAGYRVFRIVLGIYGFILGALFASGIAGPENTGWMIAAALAGGVIGALILEPGQQYLTLHYSNSYVSEIILGSLFLLVILFLPRGILPFAEERITFWRGRRDDARDAAPGAPPGAQRAAAPAVIAPAPKPVTSGAHGAGRRRAR